jgi:hypothetical protein
MMSKGTAIAALMLICAGCAPVLDVRSEARQLDRGFYSGETYQLRTVTVQRADGPEEITSVVYRGNSRVCLPDSPNDCESKAYWLIDEIKSGFP